MLSSSQITYHGAIALRKPQTPDSLAFEGRNLVDAYFAAYENWRAAAAVCTGLPDDTPYEAYKLLEARGDDACMSARICEEALLAFVVRASDRKPLDPPGDCIEMDLWPAAAVLDGRLWVAYQMQNSDAGGLELCHTFLEAVVRLPEGDGR